MNPHPTAFRRLADELLSTSGRSMPASNSSQDEEADTSLTLTVDGVPVMLRETSPSSRGGGAMLYADCGAIPPNMRADIMERVLVMNLLLYRDSDATLCLDALNQHLLLLAHVRLESATAAGVLDMARQFAKGVREYEANHFGLDNDKPAGDADQPREWELRA